jgi:hypothetical protein
MVTKEFEASVHWKRGGHYGHISLIKRINGTFGNMKEK